jgi:putative hydrolase of the HAD superfamily
MTYTTLMVDLDDTIYPSSSGLWEQIAARIDRYMHERMGFPPAEIPALRQQLHARYGTTLRGLTATYHVDELDYLAFVHDIPVQNYLSPDPRVRTALLASPLRRVIFTNADQAHAMRVLTALNLTDLFEDVIGIRDIRPYCKPMPEAYTMALAKAGATPQQCIFLDDSTRNLAGARSLGITTVLVNPAANPEPADLHIRQITDLPGLLNNLLA